MSDNLMGDKKALIEQYIRSRARELFASGMYVSDEQINRTINNYASSSASATEIIREIDELVVKFIENFKHMQELRKAYMDKMEQNKELEDLPLEYSGITINNQDIDLMLISSASTPEELQEAIRNAANIATSINDLDFSPEKLAATKEEAFRLYLSALDDRNAAIRDPKLVMRKKLEYLFDSGELTEEERTTIDNLLSTGSSADEIIEEINSSFDSDRVHRIYEIVKDCVPVEKTGIKETTSDASRKLLEQVKENYNSITIDEECRYGNVALPDGTFDYRRLDKALGFAKKLDKQVRLNTIVFYMDCPDNLYNLDVNETNRALVKERLTTYVDSVTRHVVESGYGDSIRSVDAFNELLNRFAMDGDTPYAYRGDIEQTRVNGEVDDNIKGGWLKHLSVEDLCDVVAVARKNLPNVDFMYNDDNLVDPKKLGPTTELIQRIQRYEQEHGVKLIDSIGTQMHIDNNVSIEDIANMFITLSSLGLPIEITEFDLAMIHGVEGLSDKQIEEMRQRKMNEIYACIESLREECNIRGCTIWSKTDTQNFRVFLANERLIREGKEPIKTLHGGYYTEAMESKAKELVKREPFREFNYHTHTSRCGHAGDASDADYVEAARTVGIKTLGFSDHIPIPEIGKVNRMGMDEVDDYLSSIERLRSENPDMTILSGFEAEYSPAREQHLCDMREKVDYMILGQHFVENGMDKVQRANNPNYPLEYAESVCKAMESGLFDIVAHPDIFCAEMKTITDEAGKIQFFNNTIQASRLICEKAKEMGIPLEVNLSGMNDNKGYPNLIFWQIASEVGVKVISGADAHDPNQILSMSLDEERAREMLGVFDLNMVSLDYNPAEERKKNDRLNEAFERTRENAVTYDTYVIGQAVSRMFDSQKDAADIQTAAHNVSETLRQSAEIENSEKGAKVSPRKQALMTMAASAVESSMSAGCQTKSDVMSHVRCTVEAKTQSNPQKRAVAMNTLAHTAGKPTKITSESKAIQKAPQKVYKMSNGSSNNGGHGGTGGSNSKGFASSLSISAIIGFIIFFIVAMFIIGLFK